MGVVRAEQLSPARRLVAEGDVLHQAGDLWIDSRFRVEIAVLDVAQKAAHGLPYVPAGRRELHTHDAALGHWESASIMPTLSWAATAA